MANQNSKNKNNNKKNNGNNKQNQKNNVKKDVVKKEKVVNDIVKDEKKIAEVKKEVKVEKVVTEKEAITKEKNKKEFKLTSRQKDIILVLLVAVLLVVAVIVTSNRTPELDIELPTVVEGEAGFTEISYAEYEEKINEEKPFLVIVVKDGCGYCEMYEPVVEDVANEYKIPAYYINVSNLSEDEYYALLESNTYFRKNSKWGTPTTLFMYGDYVIDYLSGYVDEAGFKDFVEENIKVDLDV
ncbi:MAG: thioredoxin family protein [Bacilli bacterium]|nr:thioredoxin family protein [Bacilli bacterium]